MAATGFKITKTQQIVEDLAQAKDDLRVAKSVCERLSKKLLRMFDDGRVEGLAHYAVLFEQLSTHLDMKKLGRLLTKQQIESCRVSKPIRAVRVYNKR